MNKQDNAHQKKCQLCGRDLGYKPKDNSRNYVCKKCFDEYEKEMEALLYD